MRHATLDIRSYPGEQCAHRHAYHQLILPREGILELEVEAKPGRVDGGHGAIIVAGEKHAYRGIGDNRLLVIDLACEGAERPSETNRIWEFAQHRPYFLVDPGLDHYTRFLALEMARSNVSAAFSQYWTSLLLLSLAERLSHRQNAYPARIQHAVRYIHTHFPRRITAQELGEAANLSVSHLHALFRACTGQTPQDYITELRLAKAMELLANTELAIAEIAAQTGYADQSALTRSLRRHRGITPGDYRKGFRV